ncbi:SDR family NAD(P)-dependent oxidoreductase [Mycobacterium yunnanensis]|uniref:SDR family NAD(P)-dependent oxidoreductase n=1 Tax=Mycobacterium yunnanensis TaxID=368477 RepID=A0A9X2Z472_9MYCO|nr:SDR family NAD(P)-dependent oxidoreductase [Mycobacterium yunnanensis]MCV7422171.1 SDR family NAD(P)-dependent oxidoreductase [Mycobacterium yunnanensis]
MKISGNTIFIPGSTSGIGLALALALRDKGNTVIVGGRRAELLDQIAAEHPDLATVQIDVSDPASISAAAEKVIRSHPDLNVLGPIRKLAAFVEHLQTQPSATVITVSSGLAFAPLKATPSYNASKAAVHMLTESLRLQYADTAVEFKELVPPSVATDLIPGQRDSSFAMPLDEFVAEVVDVLEQHPEADEILVERVKFLRYGEARGDYTDVVATLNASDPASSGA